ncbi:MAG TPA: Nramp family divalent metal transporter [Chthonomonas sp.]|nr:Nramp family divalent metal transporter [Chthonomonas sp.]
MKVDTARSETPERSALNGWHTLPSLPSLPEVFRSIPVPKSATFWRRLLAFVGPGYLVAVGYMDPGNWATDIGGGAAFAYRLLSVVLISSLMAVFLQALSAKLGIATGRDLAQACRDTYKKPIVIFLWLSAEIGIVACDIAEVIGAAIALNLLFHIPLAAGVILTGLDVLLLLALQHKGFRWIEGIVITLIATIMAVFCIELFYAHPSFHAVIAGFVPHRDIVQNAGMLYIALGILGATVMPHNLYLHSSVVQTRDFGESWEDKKDAVRMAQTDSFVALMLALFVNAAILILAAATFYRTGHHEITGIQDAYRMLTPLLGVSLATPLFAIGLLASGQNSTLTGTLAGQIILEGFLHIRIAPWLRRLISRGLAIVPAATAVILYGARGIDQLMLFSQVVLSMQLPLAVIPLIQITGDRRRMGPLVNGRIVQIVGVLLAVLIVVLNAWLIVTSLHGGH